MRTTPRVAGFRSEYPAGFELECMAGFVGIRSQVFRHGIRVSSISPGPVITALLADWPPEKLKEAKESGSLLEASEVASVVMFMLTRPRGMTIRDVVMLPTNFDL